MTINELRRLSGLKRVDFAKKYNIPLRTVEDWEAGKHNPPEYVLELLERCIREDHNLPCTYEVVSIFGYDEEIRLRTNNINDAKATARHYADSEHIEIRLYTEYCEDEEERTNFDYNIILF